MLSHRAYTLRTAEANLAAAPKRPDPSEWRKRNLADMQQKLKLDAQQTGEMTKIFDQAEQEFGQIRSKWNTENQAIQQELVQKMERVLRPDQQQLYQQYRQARDAERKRRKIDGPPPPPPPDKQ